MARSKTSRDVENLGVLVSSIRDCFSSSEHFRSTHADHMARIDAYVWTSSRYRSLPNYRKEYLRGYASALWDGLYRDKFIWVLWDRRAGIVGDDGTSLGAYVDAREIGYDSHGTTHREVWEDSAEHPGFHAWDNGKDARGLAWRAWSADEKAIRWL